MAQHQLPMNSLCAERGGAPVDEEAGGNNFLGPSPSGTYDGDSANRNNHYQRIRSHGHDNLFHGHQQSVSFTSTPSYKTHHQTQDDHCFVGSNAASGSGEHPPSVRTPPPLSGSLPPITSLGKRPLHPHNNSSQHQLQKLSCLGDFNTQQQNQQHNNASVSSLMYNSNNNSNHHHQQQQHQNSSGASSGVCSPASPFPPAVRTPMQSQQQQLRMNPQQQSNGDNEFTPLVRMGSGNGAVGQHPYSFRQQHGGGGTAAAAATNAMVAASSPMMAENHHHSQLQKQLPSPAYSVHGMNNNNSMNNHANSVMSSNPGSIISALPESPLSTHSVNNINNNGNSRSPSVRSNYSLQRMLVNSASATPPDQHSGVLPMSNCNSNQPNYGHNNGGAPLPSGESGAGRAEQQPASSSSLLMLLGEDSQQSVQNDSKASSSSFHHYNSISCGEGDSPLLHNNSSNANSSNSTGSSSTVNVGKAKRTYAARTPRTKNSLSANLPLLQQPAETFSPSVPPGDIGRLATADGPTVRQHLQQQQAAQRQRQQHEAMVRRLCQQQRDESAGGWGSGGLTAEKMQQSHQQQTNPQRRRPQIESAPPSVTTNMAIPGGGPSPCSFPPSVPSSSSAVCGAGGELQQQLLISAAPPLPSASKTLSAESLSSPTKRGGRSRAVGSTRTKTTATNSSTARVVGASTSAPGGSSADTLASTIASVASGGGSFEFEKAIGTSPLPSSLPAAGDSTAALLTPTVGSAVGPSTSAQPQQLTASPGVKRRKNQQITQTVTAIVNALEQPPIAVEQQQSLPVYGGDALSHPLQQQTSLGMQQHEQMTVPSQCRIHVQNPPQTHGDFPPTGTKIQVVHMQPPAAAISHHLHQQMSDNLSPQQQVVVSRPISSRLSTLRPDHNLNSSSSSALCDYHVANANNNDSIDGVHQIGPPSIAELSSSTEMAHHSTPRVAAAPPYSPYHHQQQVAAAFVSPVPQNQHHFYGSTMPQQLSPSSSYQYNNQPQLQHHSYHPSATGFKHPPQPSHGHFSPGGNFIVGQNNGRPFRNFPQQYARQQQHMAMDGSSPVPPPHPSPSVSGGDYFAAQSPSAHPSTSSSPATASLPGQSQHHHPVLLQRQEGEVTSPSIVTLQCTPPNSGGMYPQHQFTVPTPPTAQQQLQQSQSYHHQQQMQRYQLQQHPMGGGGQPAATNFAPQQIIVQQQQHNLPPSQPLSGHHVQPSTHQRFGAVLSPTPPASAYPSAGVVISSKVPPFFRSVPPASPFVCPAPPSVVLSQPPPMGSPLPQRAQLSRAQLLSRHSRDVEARKFAVKLYHLQRTIKALVYKNGALADELARLNQRINTVTTERKMLAKRLQHHERNRIRRIQSQYRKAIAAANNKQQSTAVEALLDEFGGEGRNVAQPKKS
ncbi:hypothetical protein niasHS_007601 [Heterodera schachtii]|uniref:Uncharacterized protein n=1 Tax=Heterodera schachtii TaxID=97005 RepID=A0ABD2JP97_HETSC